MGHRLSVLVIFGLAAMAATAVALAQVGKEPKAHAAAITASGSFEISNSHQGQPVFAASGISPGEATSGTVTIEDTGSEPLTLTLRQGGLVDEPGFGGGLLSSRLELTVVDVTDPASPRIVYSGPLASMPGRPAGTIAGGQVRTYEFTATLPEAGEPSFQNAVQGASTTIAYSWVATEARQDEPGSRAGAGGNQGGGGGRAEAARLKLIVPMVKGSAGRGRISAWTNCSMPCRLSIRGRLRAKSATTGAGRVAPVRWTSKAVEGPGPHRVRLHIPRSIRAWMRTTRGREGLHAYLRFTAVGTDGERDVVLKKVRLRSR